MECNCNKELVEIIGMCDSDIVSAALNLNPYWKQISIIERLTIPAEKPDIETLNSVNISSKILRSEVINTPRSYDDDVTPIMELPNLEGKLLSGRKVIIEGVLCERIEYTADEEEQPVNSAEFFVPFSSYIVVPKEITVIKEDRNVILDSLNIQYEINTCMENVTICKINAREIAKKVTFLLYATPTGCC